MKKLGILLPIYLALAALPVVPQSGPRPEYKKPKLVLGIVIDQFRFDYLNRFRAEFTGGFARFFKNGAVFTNAHHEHFPTVTAIGHSTFMSGATPSISGIVANQWFDRVTGKNVTSVSDENVQLLGATGRGASPRRLLASTISDEMKISGNKCKAIGVSFKDRSAILPVGHTADGAYWFDDSVGNFVSSTFYFADLPEWVKEFNASRAPDKYLGAEWKAIDSPTVFRKLAATPDRKFYDSVEGSPFGSDLLELFAERAIDAERLGQHPDTDVLTVSFSSNDYVGHALGPDAPEVRDMVIRTDRVLEKLLQFIDSRVGLANTIVVLTADHGVAPVPEVNQARKMPGGRMKQSELFGAIQTTLTARFGDGKWIVGNAGPAPYFNYALAREKKVSAAEMERVAADAARALPHIFRVYTREQLLSGHVPTDRISTRVRNGYYPSRAGDLVVIPDAYWIWEATGASHGTPFNYDTHVPILFMGPNITPGLYDGQAGVPDIAPTLAAMLQLEIPSGAIGRVLTEMLAK